MKHETMIVVTMLGYFALGPIHSKTLEIDRVGVGGGAAVNLTGGVFQVSITVGQPDAGDAPLSGGAFEATTGVVSPFDPGDCNGDGVVNNSDHAGFVPCLTGPTSHPFSTECRCIDVNGNGAIDLADFAVIQSRFTGPSASIYSV